MMLQANTNAIQPSYLRSMQIRESNDGKKGKFYIEEDGKELAVMTYVFAGDTKIIIDHTEVAEAGAGKGLGKQLVAFAVDHARSNNLKIIPLCPFAHAVFQKTKAYGDVWDAPTVS